jgi:glutamate synthase domain-containing protein 2
MLYLLLFVAFLAVVAIRDIMQNRHAITHNFPVIGHIRYLFEKIGPEIRQYFIANNREELPFSRRHRAWIYASAKDENNLTGFGTDMDFNEPGHIIIKHKMMPVHSDNIGHLPCKKQLGKGKRAKPYTPNSIVNISGMSFGALSAKAVESLNGGAKLAGCYHNTGEGGLSVYHKQGADVVFQFGTGYFGVCDEKGKFSLEKLKKLVQDNPCIKAIEIKLSQGAKPGKGGILPAAKMTQEIADARGIEMGKAAVSPSTHSAFKDVTSMINFIEEIANATGLPVGIKAAIGSVKDWEELATQMAMSGFGPDFITIDGGEGGTGAAPPSFTDHLSLPFNEAIHSIIKIFRVYPALDNVVFIGSGKLGLPANAIKAFALGCDMVNVGREALMSIGCIQAQVCHTNRCPSGVATQNKWLQNGIDPTLKSVRAANYIKQLRKEIHEMSNACGYHHPSEFKKEDLLVACGDHRRFITLKEMYA